MNTSNLTHQKVITLTDSAIKEANRRIQEERREGTSELCLRLGIKGGGCSGLSYVIKMDNTRENDLIDDSYGLKIIIDPKSALYLKDVTLDYDNSFMGNGFKFVNPQASNTCGCGESFSI